MNDNPDTPERIYGSDTVNRLPAPVKAAGTGHDSLYGLAGVALVLVVWYILYLTTGELVIASPVATFGALLHLLSLPATWYHIGVTLGRLVIGLLIGTSAGLLLGVAAGLNPKLRLLLEPLRWLSMTVPAVVLAIIALLWFGMGAAPVIFVTSIIVAPFTYVNVVNGLSAIDDKIIEMAKTFRVPARLQLSDIYLPGIGAAVVSALTLTMGMGIRVVILAELMGAHEGIGHEFSTAWNYLDTPAIFAWILVAVTLLGVLEFGILRPLSRRSMRWKTSG